MLHVSMGHLFWSHDCHTFCHVTLQGVDEVDAAIREVNEVLGETQVSDTSSAEAVMTTQLHKAYNIIYQHCDYLEGRFHQEAFLCSQVI